MTIINSRIGRLATVFAVLLSGLGVYVYLLTGTASRIPVVQPKGYTVTANLADADNLVPASQVKIAGVTVGKVRDVRQASRGVQVTIGLSNDDVVPLHKGVTVRLGERSLVGEAYLDITDGDGAPLPTGAQLPDGSVRQSTRVDDVIRSLDKEARDDLGAVVRSLGEGTNGTQGDIAATLEGLGHLGEEGNTALDAIAAQSEDLRALARETTVMLRALDTSEGDIVSMVHNADRLTNATSGQRAAIAATMRQLPRVMDSANNAATTLNDVSAALAPVAGNLKAAASPLTGALRELPATTRDLRTMLPSLSAVLDSAPATLERIPTFSDDVSSLVPPAHAMLRDINPMLSYIRPYGPELAAYFANFNSVLQYTDESGMHYIRLQPVVNEKAPQAPLQSDALGTYNNPIPPPGTGATPGPFQGEYPRIEKGPR